MADAKQIQFGQRLRRIDSHHRKLSHGYVASMNHDGLVVARPRRQSNHGPLRGIFLCLVVMLVFKGFLFSALGAATYNERVANLQAGNIFERAGSYAMKVDPLTIWVSDQIKPLLK